MAHTLVAALVGAGLLGPATLSPARADPTPPSPAPPQSLRVAVDPGAGPAAGFDRDLFAAVAQEIGAAPVFAEAPREAALSGLGAGRYDVAAGPFAPAEATGPRGPIPVPPGLRWLGPFPPALRWLGPFPPGLRWLGPFAPGGDALLKRRGDGAIQSGTDLAGKVVGLAGSPAEVARLRARAAKLGSRPVLRPAWRAATLPDDVAAGRLAAVIGPLDALAATVLARPDRFELVGLAGTVGDRRGPVLRSRVADAALAGAVAAALARMAADGRLATLQRKWFGLALDPPPPPR